MCLLENSDHVAAVTDAILSTANAWEKGTGSAAIRVDTLRGGAVPEAGTLGINGDPSCPSLEGFDVVRENPSPAVAGVAVVDIDFGSSLGSALGSDCADVVR